MAEKTAGLRWRSWALTDVGKRREINEDAFLNQPETGLWAVADGMGGHSAGDVASRMVVDKLGQLPATGSLVALETAARHPARVRALALLGSSAPMPVGQPLLDAAQAGHHAALDMITLWGQSNASQIGGNRAPGMWLTGGALRLLERAAPGVLYTDLNACNEYCNGLESAARVGCPSLLILGDVTQLKRGLDQHIEDDNRQVRDAADRLRIGLLEFLDRTKEIDFSKGQAALEAKLGELEQSLEAGETAFNQKLNELIDANKIPAAAGASLFNSVGLVRAICQKIIRAARHVSDAAVAYDTVELELVEQMGG